VRQACEPDPGSPRTNPGASHSVGGTGRSFPWQTSRGNPVSRFLPASLAPVPLGN